LISLAGQLPELVGSLLGVALTQAFGCRFARGHLTERLGQSIQRLALLACCIGPLPEIRFEPI
jgi:hypothetical protein